MPLFTYFNEASTSNFMLLRSNAQCFHACQSVSMLIFQEVSIDAPHIQLNTTASTMMTRTIAMMKSKQHALFLAAF